tara:strand:- start:324 stop:608 length:285 start_codon:yes stop_codon:yes gene_type:complete
VDSDGNRLPDFSPDEWPSQKFDDKFTWSFGDDDGKYEVGVSLITPPLTNSVGFYSIESLPIGTMTLHAWALIGTDSETVTVTGDNAIKANFVLK